MELSTPPLRRLPASPKERRLNRFMEKWRQAVSLDLETWCEIIELSEKQYRSLHEQGKSLPLSALVRAAEHFDVSLELVMEEKVDFRSIAERMRGNQDYIPERYSVAAFSKRRTSGHLLDYIGRFHGATLRAQVLRRFEMNESVFRHPEKQINILFVSDLYNYLNRIGFDDRDLLTMGAYSLVSNYGTPLAESLARYENQKSLHEGVFADLIGNHWDKNHDYRLTRLSETGCTVESTAAENLLDLLKLRRIGNWHGCIGRGGTFSSLSGYLGQRFSKVRHSRCVHRGDGTCRYELEFASESGGLSF